MLTIVRAEPDDATALADLIDELDHFYGAVEFTPAEERVKGIQAMVFREQPAAYVLLAKDHRQVIGFAAYSYLWPAVGLTQSLYLKELYVREDSRRKGVGKLLMDRLLEIAVANGCSRVEWAADSDNPLALGFYRKLGYQENQGKVLFRVGLK
jgi:ribosomal protein S18 acetylase RimI-like enzyme